LLRPLVADVRSALRLASATVPVLIKIGPDLADRELDAVADLAVSLGLDSIVAVNTTVDRGGLVLSAESAAAVQGGGVSGAPLKARALEVLQRLHARVGTELVLVSVGGIESSDDVWERIIAGATLVQAHTGFIYGGPAWPRRINRGLLRRVADAGLSSVEEAIGSASDPRRGRCGVQRFSVSSASEPVAASVRAGDLVEGR
jgi:dihydroorotate dehydrogenase